MSLPLILIGSAIILAVIVAMIIGTAREMGWKEAALVWGFAFGLTTVVAAGALLIEAGVKS